MKRKTNTLDAEYKRLGLIRPNQIVKTLALLGQQRTYMVGTAAKVVERHTPGKVITFDWRGTKVWGVKA